MNDELPAGTLIGGDYRVLETLGRGGFALTYKCEDIHLNILVAVKEYYPEGGCYRKSGTLEVMPNANTLETYRWGLNKFLIEGNTLAAIQEKYRSDLIVQIKRFIEERSTAYLVMEYIDGVAVDVFSNHITSADQVEHLFHELCPALKLIHEAKFYHRDIKPENILVRKSNNQPVIIDFGAARQIAGGKNTFAVLTARYAAVEQYASLDDPEGNVEEDLCGPFTDIYSLSATFYSLIKGEPPQDAPSRLLDDKVDLLVEDKTLSSYSEEFLAYLDWGMAPFPKDRPQSIEQWMTKSTSRVGSLSHPDRSVRRETSAALTKGPKGLIERNLGRWNDLSFSTQRRTIFSVFGLLIVGTLLVISMPTSNPVTSGNTVVNSQSKTPAGPTIVNPSPVSTKASISSSASVPTSESWTVGIDGVGWTPVNAVAKTKAFALKVDGPFQIKLHGGEPFRVKTDKGLAITRRDALRFGGISGEVYLKSVNGKPQTVRVELVQDL